MGIPARHEQPYSQVVLKIRAAKGESGIGGVASGKKKMQVGARSNRARK
jgi:hypothetical protein